MTEVKRDDKGYYEIDGVKYPSVTTILNVHSKPALYMFYGKHGIQGARKLSKEATDIGTEVHTYIENYWDETSFEITKGQKAYQSITNFHKMLDECKLEYVPCTRTVYNTKHGYAGAIDDLYRDRKGLILVDYKTSKDIYPEYLYQLEAYCRAWNRMKEHLDRPIQRYMVIRLAKDKSFNLTKDVYCGTLDDIVFKGFLGMLDTFNSDVHIKNLRRKKK